MPLKKSTESEPLQYEMKSTESLIPANSQNTRENEKDTPSANVPLVRGYAQRHKSRMRHTTSRLVARPPYRKNRPMWRTIHSLLSFFVVYGTKLCVCVLHCVCHSMMNWLYAQYWQTTSEAFQKPTLGVGRPRGELALPRMGVSRNEKSKLVTPCHML